MVATLVLVLWFFTAGAGFSVLISSNLKRDRSPAPVPSAPVQPVPVASVSVASVASVASAVPAASPVPAASAAARSASSAEAKRARREQYDPTALVAAREAPIMPGARALLEFSHPACGIIGLAFWLGFTLVHARVFGWIGFGLATVTACAGLTWFALNIRAARRTPDAPAPDAPGQDASAPDAPGQGTPALDAPAPSFRGRLVALHGAAAALTVVLAALSAVVLHG